MTDFDDVFAEYSNAIASGATDTLEFILTRKKSIRSAVGFTGFKQFTLNYRIYFDHRNMDRIIADYKTYVLSKQTRHKSDLAISHNLLTKIPNLSSELEHQVVDFMFDRMKDTYLVKFKHLANLPHGIKKHLCITHVYDELLRVKNR
jgi:hypothetical protein